MNEREQLEQAIAALEAQRALLSDAVVNAAVAPMREKLAALQAPHPPAEQQRKHVTVLFADVSGFTAMSETMDPEEVSTTMNALWSRLDTAIIHYGGHIDKHIGDAVMALFGAPTAQEDDPERAIRAALAMQSELASFRAEQNLALAMRIGINTGLVLLGAVGTTGEYTAMGDAVNLASRLEHAAPVGGILISHDTYRHVRGVFDVLALDPISVKGKVEPIQVYLVRAAKPRAFRVSTRGIEGIETRTIGRENELRQLQAALTAAQQFRKTHLASIVAEAGVGKSRLLYEFTNWLDVQPERTLIFKGRTTQEMANLPYSLIRDVLSFRCGIQESDPAAVAREKLEIGILDFLGSHDIEKAHFIGHLIGFDFSSSPYLQGIMDDARQIRDRAFHYIAQFFTAVTGQRRTALLLEDIHWADDGSLDLIDHIVQECPDLPLLIIGLTRPTLFERRPNWGEGTATHVRLDLHPLSEDTCRHLIAEILRFVPEIPSTLQELIVSRAEGNPFYVEELIKMLIEDGVIVTGEEHWQVVLGRLATVRVPATLTGVLQARLDGLPPPEREALQRAAVVGRVFWDSVLEQLHDPNERRSEPRTAIGERLTSLYGKELIFPHETSSFDETAEYIFKHAILHDVTYESVLKRLRRAYHAQVAEGLIQLSGERVSEYAGRIGEHYERAEQSAQAAVWYGRAGKQAQDTYATEAAISYYQKALTLWRKDPTATPTAQRFEVNEGLGEMLVAQARYAEGIEVFTAMRELAAGDLRVQSRAWYGLSTAQSNQGDHRAALESSGKAEEAAQAAGARVELAMALWMKGRSLFRLGDAHGALTLGEQVLAISTELGDQRQIARSLNLLGVVHMMLGRYELATDCFTRALAICQALGDRSQMMRVLSNLGVIADRRADYRTAFGRFEQALAIAREIGDRYGEFVFLSNLGASRIGLGQYQAAEADLRRVIEMAGTPHSQGLSDTYYYLAKAYLGQGKVAEALVAAGRALELGQEIEEQAFIAAAWRVLGTVSSHMAAPITINDKDGRQTGVYDAAACFAESLRICTETGMEGERARTLRAWATYELERGDHVHGMAMWQEARDLFAKLGVDLEVERMDKLPNTSVAANS
jgi:class 3 adenylate cyclase/tetratricopeptide (TPR) repeat protein